MLWLPLSLVAAFASATADALLKRHFHHLSPYEMGAVRLVYALPWLAIGLLFIPWPAVDRLFFTAIACGLPLEITALLCYMKAIKVSPLSLTLPFLAFTPAFLVLSGRIILHENLTFGGMLGILLIVAGSYCLHLSEIRAGLFAPFRAIAREQGSRLMLLTALIYSITSALGKLGVLHSSPAFFGIVYFTCLSVIMLAVMPLVPGLKMQRLGGKPLAGLTVGITYAVMVFSHMAAISMVQAAYMIALKRTSLLIGVLYGAFLFREEKIYERLIGAAIMLGGVFAIGLFG
ncbi:MAG TPA: DMT family transporter [Deltaproteobacteria bacterium]|nr:DMT family transporter [Deltaproteobacteria bacterium]HPR55420.1 DMT family transporter [Deltaproteobacteria bacterium]HXK48140.1 DMT family transporter [Deltaproteobacteria bacterium]